MSTAPNERKEGVCEPGERRKTFDFRHYPGSFENSAGIEPWYVTTTLEEMLEHRYETDAHFVAYILCDEYGRPFSKQPRINKSSVPWLYSLGYEIKYYCMIGDWDNPGHLPWTDDGLDESWDKWRTHPWLKGLGGYYGLRGQRVFQSLVEPIPVFAANGVIERWHKEGVDAGIPLDLKCASWSHNFRAPNVIRDGKRLQSNSSYFDMVPRDLSRFAKIPRFDPATLAALGEKGRATLARYIERYGQDEQIMTHTPRRSHRQIRISGAWVKDLPETWKDRCDQIAQICAQVPLGERHEFYRHLAGGFCHLRVPLECIPTIVQNIASRAGHDGDHHARTARDTVYRHADGQAVTGLRRMQNRYPELSALLDKIGIRPRAPKVAAQQEAARAKAVPPTRLEVVQEELLAEMLFGPMGITILQIECGGGKTYTAQQAAAERALHTPRTPTGRVPSEGRTILSADTHRLVLQTAKGIEERHHLPVYRGYGPASLFDPDGTPVCRHHASAKPLSQAHVPIGQALCVGNGKSKCEYFEGCRAREGWEGDEDAAILLTVHAKLHAAVGYHGKKSLLIIDEPPSPLENETIDQEELEVTLKTLGAFDRRYANALEPLVHVARAWLAQSPLNLTDYNLMQLCEMVGNHVPLASLKIAAAATEWSLIGDVSTDALECAERALPQDSGKRLPIQVYELAQARRSPGRAKTLAKAAKVLYVLHQAARGMSAATKPILKAEFGKKHNALRLIYPNHAYRTILQNQDRTLMLDANGALHVHAIKALTGREPSLKKFSIEDSAPIERSIMPYRDATRANWQPYGVPLWANGITKALAQALEYARQPFQFDPNAPPMVSRHVGLISYLPIIVALGVCMYPEDRSWVARWNDLGLDPRLLAFAVEQNGPVLSGWEGTLTLGYYGALKGLNSMSHCDMTITLGDPRPSVDIVELEAKFLGLPAEDYVLLNAQASLEQSHGRLRAAQRKSPGRMLHVGQVLPSGFGWDSAKSLQLPQGAEHVFTTMTLSEFTFIVNELGITYGQLAAYLGVHPNTITSYVQGRNIPRGIAISLRNHYHQTAQSHRI